MSRPHIDRETTIAALDALLPGVEKPTRYIGGEWNSIVKDPSQLDCSIALAFPDLYEIGMSHLGFRILYSILNDLDRVAAERVFMPWSDMLQELRQRRLPLTSLETRRPLAEFDIVGFSMQYELTITNLLAMLDLGGIPLTSAERGEDDPLVLAGGPVVFNAEPFADFCDMILIGDAEEAFPEWIDTYRKLRREGATRRDLLRAAARIEGWYVPSLYDLEREPRVGFMIPRPKAGEPASRQVVRRLVTDLDRYPFPEKIVVAHSEIVHDRVSWELMRGCPVGCRFCQAGYIYRPTRERSPEAVRSGVRRSIEATGYDEFSLTSLNTGEYGAIVPLLTDLMDEMTPRKVAVGLSSLHATTLTESLVEQVKRVRKAGFTIAPEAGSQRMRNVINKNLTEDDILRATRLAYEAGWEAMKLYFMVGLPTESMEDVDGIVDLSRKIVTQGRQVGSRRVRATLSASTFVPKPFTPFQWFGMDSEAAFRAKQDRIRDTVPRGVDFRHHNHGESWLEGVFSRADRSVAPAILEAYRRGAVLDSWSEHFNQQLWRQVFEDCAVDAERFATQQIPLDAELPWDVIDPLIRRKWLEVEYLKSLEASTMATCKTACSGCAPFSPECVKGDVAQHKWVDIGVKAPLGLPAYHVKKAPPGRGEVVSHDNSPGAPPTIAAVPTPSPEPVPLSESAGSPATVALDPPAPIRLPLYRYRARFEKLGRARLLGHLDMVRAISMGLRRAGIQVAYSEGFKPRPKVSFSPALSLGVASRAEFIDFELSRAVDEERLMALINSKLQEGIRFTALVEIDSFAPSLQETITLAQYRSLIPGSSHEQLEQACAALQGREQIELVRTRKGKEKRIDLRPLLGELAVDAEGALLYSLRFDLTGSVKYSELLALLVGEELAAQAVTERVAQFSEQGGRRLSPLVAGRIVRARTA